MYSNTNAENSESASRGLLSQAIQDVPQAVGEMASEAWQHPLSAGWSLAKTAAESAAMGYVLGAIFPAGGRAARALTLVLGGQTLWGFYNQYSDAAAEAARPGASQSDIAMKLSRSMVGDVGDFALGSVAGGFATHFGHKLALSDTTGGAWAQSGQRLMLKGENAWLNYSSLKVDAARGWWQPGSAPAAERLIPSSISYNSEVNPLQTRIAQLRINAMDSPAVKYNDYVGDTHAHSVNSDGELTPEEVFKRAKAQGDQFFFLTEHDHWKSRKGVPEDDPRHAAEEGVPIITANPAEYTAAIKLADSMTDDSFVASAENVEHGTIGQPPKPPKGAADHAESDAGTEAGHSHAIAAPLLGQDGLPEVSHMLEVQRPDGTLRHHYILPREIAPAKVESIRTRYAGRSGATARELSFSSEPPSSPSETGFFDPISEDEALKRAADREKGHHSGVNHVNVYGLPKDTLLEANVLDKNPGSPKAVESGSVVRPAATADSPRIVAVDDGDYKTLTQRLQEMSQANGRQMVVTFNHPRWRAVNNPKLPANLRNGDYGTKSFKNEDEWSNEFARPFVGGIETMKGGALDPDPMDTMSKKSIMGLDYVAYNGQIHSDGRPQAHLGSVFGRDYHLGPQVKRPGGTIAYAPKLTYNDILDSMRERRTSATTSSDLLRGYITANDSHFMGAILDQNAVHDLTFKAHIGGKVDPKANYTVTLWGDKVIGDGKFAENLQEVTISGDDLAKANGQVAFDQLQHKLGTSSNYFVEVQRTDPITQNVDYLYTSPIWVEPSGTMQHSILNRAVIGGATSMLPSWLS
jgi:hypothetical protein